MLHMTRLLPRRAQPGRFWEIDFRLQWPGGSCPPAAAMLHVMVPCKRSGSLFAAVSVVALTFPFTVIPLLWADVISQTNSEGRQVVITRDAIVIRQDSAALTYKHFDLKERRVVKAVLHEGSLPYNVARGSADSRQQTVVLWKRFGFIATVTDTAGKTTRVCDAFIDFYPPKGQGSLLKNIPARTDFPVQLANGGADLVSFADISRVEFQGEQLRITTSNGQVKEGHFLMPTQEPAEARFLGITDRYDPASEDVFDFSLPLAQIKQIDFEQ